MSDPRSSLRLAVGGLGVDEPEPRRAELDPHAVVVALRDAPFAVELADPGLEALQALDAEPRIADRLASRQRAQDERVVDVVDPLPDRLLVLGLEHPLGAGGDERARLPLVRDVEGVSDVDVVLRRAARDGPVELAVGDELGVGVEDRVGAEAGLEDVGPRLGDLEELGTEVEAPLEGRVDGPIERDSVFGSVVIDLRGDLERPVEGRGRGRDRLRLGRGHRLLQQVGDRVPGVKIEVEIPLGVETPGRPPRICPVPGELPLRAPPPAPGEGPSRDVEEPEAEKLGASAPGV